MAKANNKKEVKKIEVRIVYDNFIDKYTKKHVPINTIMPMDENRINKTLEKEKEKGVKLIEILDADTNLDDTNINNEDGGENTNADNTNNGAGIDENENVDNGNANNEDGGENTNADNTNNGDSIDENENVDKGNANNEDGGENTNA